MLFHSYGQQADTFGVPINVIGAHSNVSTRHGQQKYGIVGNCTSLSTLSATTETTSRSQATVARTSRALRNVHELHGSCGNAIHDVSKGTFGSNSEEFWNLIIFFINSVFCNFDELYEYCHHYYPI